ncbi:MAG: mechanosensitive ion channel [Candidatus Woesearchaeota archaeon]|nr:mechanosensitive ion channel [Candidatus Woesearchaeota archaeon]
MAAINLGIEGSLILLRAWYIKIIAAVLIVFIGFIIGKLIGKTLFRIFNNLEINNMLNSLGIKIDAEKRVSSLAEYFVYFVTIIIFLNNLGVTTTIIYILAGAVAVVFVGYSMLAMKDFIPNMFAGFYMNKHKMIKKGKLVKTGNVEGRVVEINLIETKIKTRQKTAILSISLIQRSQRQG